MRHLPLLWYISNLLLDQFGKQRMAPIILPGKSDLLAEVMGIVLPTMFQALIKSGPIMVITPLLVRPLLLVFLIMTW